MHAWRMGKVANHMTPTDARHRAGHYVAQPGGYRAFLPAPLPPDPPILVGDELQALLSRADRALGRLDGSIQTLPHPDLFVAMYVRKEAVLSSQIEGTQSSLQDVLAAENPPPRSNTPSGTSAWT
jgi:Fic family protein